VRRPRVGFADRYSGGAGAPPVPTTRPCQELADDLSIALPPLGDLSAMEACSGPLSLLSAVRLSVFALPASGLLERDGG